jgi:hypothetical protein
VGLRPSIFEQGEAKRGLHLSSASESTKGLTLKRQGKSESAERHAQNGDPDEPSRRRRGKIRSVARQTRRAARRADCFPRLGSGIFGRARAIESRSLSERGGGLLRGRGSAGKIGGNGLENVNSLRRTSRSAFHQTNMDVFGCGPPRESVVHRIGCRQRRLLSLLGQVWSRPPNGRAGRRSMSRRARPPRPAAACLGFSRAQCRQGLLLIASRGEPGLTATSCGKQRSSFKPSA